MNSAVEEMVNEESGQSFRLESAGIGEVGLIVSDLQRSIDFYAGVVGLDVLSQDARSAQLGVAADRHALLSLEQRPGIRPLQRRRLGLYHTAVLLPSRSALASFAEHLQRHGIRAGSSNHLVSEAFYLRDPDGLEVEVYADRPPEMWPWRGDLLDAAVLPLDVANLLKTPHETWKGVPSATMMGHLHFYIGNEEQAAKLYQHGLGLNPRTRSIPGALFLAAGNYHHHIGLNTWAGAVPVASENDSRLSWWKLCVPQRQVFILRERMLASGWQPGNENALLDAWNIQVRLAPTE